MTSKLPVAAPDARRASTQSGQGTVQRRLFDFPNPVNEYAARITAGLVVVLAVVTW